MKIKITRDEQTTKPGAQVITMHRDPAGFYAVFYLKAVVGPDNRLYWRMLDSVTKGATETVARRAIQHELSTIDPKWEVAFLEGAVQTGLCP